MIWHRWRTTYADATSHRLVIAAYRDWLDYVIVENGRNVGRLYEDPHSPPEYRWFWSITVYVNPKLGIITSGRAPSIDQAKAQFLASWQKIPR
jgi:hypothetical protein